jgi:hypothetical protein
MLCICGNNFKNLKALNYHKKNYHIKCLDCYKWFIDSNEFKNHKIECEYRIQLLNNKINDFNNSYIIHIITNDFYKIDIEKIKLLYMLYAYSKIYNDPFFISSTMIKDYLAYSYKKESNILIENTFKEQKKYVSDDSADISIHCKNNNIDNRYKEYFIRLSSLEILCTVTNKQNGILFKYMIELVRLIEDNKNIDNIYTKLQNINEIYNNMNTESKDIYIYLITTDINGVYKIGWSYNVKNRIVSLQSICINDIKIIYTVKSNIGVLLETLTHKELDEYRIPNRKELFKVNTELAIKTINRINNDNK